MCVSVKKEKLAYSPEEAPSENELVVCAQRRLAEAQLARKVSRIVQVGVHVVGAAQLVDLQLVLLHLLEIDRLAVDGEQVVADLDRIARAERHAAHFVELDLERIGERLLDLVANGRVLFGVDHAGVLVQYEVRIERHSVRCFF